MTTAARHNPTDLSPEAQQLWSRGIALVLLIHCADRQGAGKKLKSERLPTSLWMLPAAVLDGADEHPLPWEADHEPYESTEFGILLHGPSIGDDAEEFRDRLAATLQAAGVSFTLESAADD